jgi:hypothetical protein
MKSLTGLLFKWPLIRQIDERAAGTGLGAMSNKTCAMHALINDTQVARSNCPYRGTSSSRRGFCA